MRALMVLLMALLSGCGTDLWDPVGTYETGLFFGSGDCNVTDPRQFLFAVATRPDGTFLMETNPESDVEGQILQIDDKECRLEFMVEEPPSQELNFVGRIITTYSIIDDGGNLDGTGLLTVGSPENCTQTLVVGGVRRGI